MTQPASPHVHAAWTRPHDGPLRALLPGSDDENAVAEQLAELALRELTVGGELVVDFDDERRFTVWRDRHGAQVALGPRAHSVQVRAAHRRWVEASTPRQIH